MLLALTHVFIEELSLKLSEQILGRNFNTVGRSLRSIQRIIRSGNTEGR